MGSHCWVWIMEGSVEFNMDKRTRRKVDRTEYQRAINVFRNEIRQNGIEILNPSTSQTDVGPDISVFIRKRPIFSYEEERGEYDVITIPNDGMYPGVVVSQCRQRIVPKKGIVRELGNVFYPCTHAFDENVENEEIYHRCGKPLLDIVNVGGIATCFMFGQTGSGKTHTMSAIQRYLAGDLVSLVRERSESNNDHLLSVEMIFYELVGKKVFDLLESSHKELKLLSDSDGKIHVSGATRILLNNLSAEDIVALQVEALERRETASTGSNATSSRSHAICQIIFSTNLNPRYGILTLVDLAGSERKEDSCYHDRVTQLQTAEINTSLMALKECLRTKSIISKNYKKEGKSEETSQQVAPHIPYRNSNLTKILKESFESKSVEEENSSLHQNCSNLIHVIFTLTPTATNTEHSVANLNLISSILNLRPNTSLQSNLTTTGGLYEYVTEVKPLEASISSFGGSRRSDSIDSVHPSKWTVEMVKGWVGEEVRRLRGDGNEGEILFECSVEKILKRIEERKISGKELMKWNERRITGEFFDWLEELQNDRQMRERWGAQIFQVWVPFPSLTTLLSLNPIVIALQALREKITERKLEEERIRKEFLKEKQKKLSVSSTYSRSPAPPNPTPL
jgi:hypothetical protein